MENESQIAINLIIKIIDMEIEQVEKQMLYGSGLSKDNHKSHGARDALVKIKAEFIEASSS